MATRQRNASMPFVLKSNTVNLNSLKSDIKSKRWITDKINGMLTTKRIPTLNFEEIKVVSSK